MTVLNASLRPTLSRGRKRPEDTEDGCRAHAVDDLHRAAALSGQPISWRFEHSAAAWTARANLLARREAQFQARMPAARR